MYVKNNIFSPILVENQNEIKLTHYFRQNVSFHIVQVRIVENTLRCRVELVLA